MKWVKCWWQVDVLHILKTRLKTRPFTFRGEGRPCLVQKHCDTGLLSRLLLSFLLIIQALYKILHTQVPEGKSWKIKQKSHERERPRQTSVCFGEGFKDPTGNSWGFLSKAPGSSSKGGPWGSQRTRLSFLGKIGGRWSPARELIPHTSTTTHSPSLRPLLLQTKRNPFRSQSPLLPLPPEVLYASFSSRAVDWSSRLSRLP